MKVVVSFKISTEPVRLVVSAPRLPLHAHLPQWRKDGEVELIKLSTEPICMTFTPNIRGHIIPIETNQSLPDGYFSFM